MPNVRKVWEGTTTTTCIFCCGKTVCQHSELLRMKKKPQKGAFFREVGRKKFCGFHSWNSHRTSRRRHFFLSVRFPQPSVASAVGLKKRQPQPPSHLPGIRYYLGRAHGNPFFFKGDQSSPTSSVVVKLIFPASCPHQSCPPALYPALCRHRGLMRKRRRRSTDERAKLRRRDTQGGK